MEEMQLPFKKSYDETKETDINVSLTKNNENQIGYEETEKQLNTGVSNLSDVSQIKSEIYDNILNMYNNGKNILKIILTRIITTKLIKIYLCNFLYIFIM